MYTVYIATKLLCLQWMQLRNRKQNLVRLFEHMQQFQFEQLDPEKPLESQFRTLSEEDLERYLFVCGGY